MSAEQLVGVDVGGSGIRVLATTGTSTRHAQNRGPVPRRHGMIDEDALSDQIVSIARQALVGDGHVGRVAVGLTGMPGLLGAPNSLGRSIQRGLGAGSVVIASDALTTHLGALGGRSGVVVSAGTGLIALGTDLQDVWNRADGWGYLLGDEGGGAWIGLRGLNAALRAHDGRPGGSRHLLRRAFARFGGSVDDVLEAVYGSPSPAREAAAFAREVAESARDGDVVSQSIWAEAGTHIAKSACAAASDLPPRFSWAGKLFSAGEILLEPFRREIVRQFPEAELIPPRGQAADGALMLARSSELGESAAAAYLHEYRDTPEGDGSV